LPTVGFEYRTVEIPPSMLERARRNLDAFNGHYYREFFDPAPQLDDDMCMGDIGDDVLDTYLDVRNGLLLFEQGQIKEALCYWSYFHRTHWGRHAAGAIRALRCLAIENQTR
jgi:hypothetical protein